MLPEPSGAGSLSPTPGLRTAVIAWSDGVAGQIGVRIGAGVEQLRRQLEVRVRDRQEQRRWRRPAAARRRSRAASRRPASSRSRPRPPSAARARRRARPSRTANSSGVKPDGRRVRKSAPASMSACTTAAWPSAAAHISAVCPRRSSLRVDTSAPRDEQRLHGLERAGARGGHQRRLAARQRARSDRRRPSAAARPSRRCRSCRPARAASRRSGSPPSRWRRRGPAVPPISRSSW